MADRASGGTPLDRPMAIYEVHAGSWRRNPLEGFRSLTWRELTAELVPYTAKMGFTHVELMPVMEHPFEGSWGYQVSGFFAPTSRLGSPDDFRAFVDACHGAGIGVILDWVPAIFRKTISRSRFDGSALYEHEDPAQGEHRDWGTLIFNYGRHEVRNFLLTNALYWLRVIPRRRLARGRGGLDAVLRLLARARRMGAQQVRRPREPGSDRLPSRVEHDDARRVPGTITLAEESTAFPAVSRPTWVGGLGFTFKWNMGWMHDILTYIAKDPVYRRWEHQHLTFSMLYAFNENFVLPFSHDEVVHGKGSMMQKMPGDEWQKAATLRLLYAFMTVHPGKKLMFMGNEFGQWREWNHDDSLEWSLLEQPRMRVFSGLCRI
jgi:1,4-alpha-glucan branching enzyme